MYSLNKRSNLSIEGKFNLIKDFDSILTYLVGYVGFPKGKLINVEGQQTVYIDLPLPYALPDLEDLQVFDVFFNSFYSFMEIGVSLKGINLTNVCYAENKIIIGAPVFSWSNNYNQMKSDITEISGNIFGFYPDEYLKKFSIPNREISMNNTLSPKKRDLMVKPLCYMKNNYENCNAFSLLLVMIYNRDYISEDVEKVEAYTKLTEMVLMAILLTKKYKTKDLVRMDDTYIASTYDIKMKLLLSNIMENLEEKIKQCNDCLNKTKDYFSIKSNDRRKIYISSFIVNNSIDIEDVENEKYEEDNLTLNDISVIPKI